MLYEDIIRLVEDTAKVRGDKPVQKKFIEEAVIRFFTGVEDVPKYPTGMPQNKALYEVALRLETEALGISQ